VLLESAVTGWAAGTHLADKEAKRERTWKFGEEYI
jgi:hypothetical protein